MNEIEIVILQRVGLKKKNDFDLVVVFKDFNRLMRIDLIMYSSLVGIKKLLRERDITYFGSRLSLNWHHILKAIRDCKVKVRLLVAHIIFFRLLELIQTYSKYFSITHMSLVNSSISPLILLFLFFIVLGSFCGSTT